MSRGSGIRAFLTDRMNDWMKVQSRDQETSGVTVGGGKKKKREREKY